MRSFLTIVCSAWLSLALASCAKTTTDSNLGTNTNWLRTCEDTSDCEGDDVCVCGQCTLACTASSECGSVHEAASCERVEDDVCGDNLGVASACLQGCKSDDDCTALRDGICVSGLCVPESRRQQGSDAGGRDDGGGSIEDAGRRDGSVVGGDSFALTYSAGTIQITAAYTDCVDHRDCTLVETSCDGCCGQGAITRSLTETYSEQMTLACADYEGFECACTYRDLVARCVDDRCAAVPRADTECYSHASPEGAYDADSVGCSCDDYAMKSICTGRYALVCSYDGRVYAWTAVEDGPCGEPTPDPDCTEGELRPTATSCLDDFDWCWELENGEYCGVAVLVDP